MDTLKIFKREDGILEIYRKDQYDNDRCRLWFEIETLALLEIVLLFLLYGL